MNEHETTGERIETDHAERRLRQLLDFEAPFLEETLLREGKFHSRQEFERTFTELKKYFWLSAHEGRELPMTSRLIDEVWHQFILFTPQYHEFCDRFFGRYLHHSPQMSHASAEGDLNSVTEFFLKYRESFGPVARLWIDNQPIGGEAMSDPWGWESIATVAGRP